MKTTDMVLALSLMAGAAQAAPGTARPVTQAGDSLPAGTLKCGVITEPFDWNKQDLHGNLAALEAEICRATAAALFGRPDRVELQAYNTEEEGLNGLRHGASDIVAGITPSAQQEATGKIRFSLPIFEDTLGFMVHRAEGIHSIADITGHKLCYIEDTDNDHTILPYLMSRGTRPLPFGFQEEGEMDAAIMDRHCQATGAMLSKLAEARATFHNINDYVFLPEMLDLSPITIASDAADVRLGAIVDYTISVLLQAEFLGVTRAQAAALPHSEDPRLQRLSGEDYATGQALGLPHGWSRKVIEGVGNYAEIYDRTIGPGTKYNLARGLNALWNKGGLMAPLPLK
jgi:general L-amino acid transport system substrate-binding protein